MKKTVHPLEEKQYMMYKSMQFTEQNNVWSGKYHELIAINSNIKLKLIREARNTEAPLKKKNNKRCHLFITNDSQ